MDEQDPHVGLTRPLFVLFPANFDLSIIGIAASHRFVMDALLAFSAEHISNITGCPMVGKMVFEHRSHAMVGLGKALNAFSEDNSDAILAASLVLSWQATDWRSWTQHMQGTRGVC